MLPIGSAFANGHLTSGLSSLLGRLKHSPSPVLPIKFSSGADGIIEELSEISEPNEKEVTACSHHVLYSIYCTVHTVCRLPASAVALQRHQKPYLIKFLITQVQVESLNGSIEATDETCLFG